VKILAWEALAEEPALAGTLFKPATSNDTDVATGAAALGCTNSVGVGTIAKSCATALRGKPMATTIATLTDNIVITATFCKPINESHDRSIFIATPPALIKLFDGMNLEIYLPVMVGIIMKRY
jgi:hypothetical protein